MAIGTTAALIGSAVIGAGASAIGSSSQKKAANKASQVAADNTAANNALAREIYGQNSNNLRGYQTRGEAAGNAINALLGLPTYQEPQPTYTPSYGGYGYPNALAGFGDFGGIPYLPRGDVYAWNTPYQPPAQPAPQNTRQEQESAFARFRDSTGYQFRFNEGSNALNANYAAKGLLTSGAAQKALTRYGQDYGSNEFGNYFNMLNNQQQMGLSGASALAGVGQSYAGTVAANNNAAATAAANAALMKGQANANMWGGIAGGIGNVLGASSYGRAASGTSFNPYGIY